MPCLAQSRISVNTAALCLVPVPSHSFSYFFFNCIPCHFQMELCVKNDFRWTFNTLLLVLGTDHTAIRYKSESEVHTRHLLISWHILFLFCYSWFFFLIMVGWNADQMSTKGPFLWRKWCYLKGKERTHFSSTLRNVEFTVGVEAVLRREHQGSAPCSWFWWFPLVMDSSALRVGFWFLLSSLLLWFLLCSFPPGRYCGKCYHKL